MLNLSLTRHSLLHFIWRE